MARVWLVTGASRGLGRAITRAALDAGETVVATARSADAVRDGLEGSHDRLHTLALDITDAEAARAVASETASRFGSIDVLVNNAGYALMGDTEAAGEDQARAQVETNFWGTARLSVHAMRVMREENGKDGPRGGLVMNVTSVGGFMGFPSHAYYHASKFAVEGFTESIAREVRPEWNIHFTLIEPGGVQTNFAHTGFDSTPVHPAYAAPDSPSRVMLAMVRDPAAAKTWARPEAVAEAMYGVASRGGPVPIRVPLGASAWAVMRGKVDALAADFDKIKDVSLSVGGTIS